MCYLAREVRGLKVGRQIPGAPTGTGMGQTLECLGQLPIPGVGVIPADAEG